MQDDGLDRDASRVGCEDFYHDANQKITAALKAVDGIGTLRWRDSDPARWDTTRLSAGKRFTVETVGDAPYALRISGAVYWCVSENHRPTGQVDDLTGTLWRTAESDRSTHCNFAFGRKNHHNEYPLRDADPLTRMVNAAIQRLG